VSALPERPRLADRVRLAFDRHTGRHVLLYPERGLALNATSAAIAELLTGAHRVHDIIDALSRRYPGSSRAHIERDVLDFLGHLHARGLLAEAT
jgi:coenzyme PQQ biosynthesis protein PqqD